MKQLIKFCFLYFGLNASGQSIILFKDVPLPKHEANNEVVLKWNKNQPGLNELSAIEQQFYYWVNYSRKYPSQFFDSIVTPLANIYSQLKGSNYKSLEADLKNAGSISLLDLNSVLSQMAAYQAKDITTNNASPSHTSTNGETFVDRFKQFGFKNCGGENISYGASNATPIFMLVMLYLDINVPDLGHRKALLNPNYTSTGISVYAYKNGNIFLVEDFACAQN
ncbi:MAG: CAP domain-containing protein [Parafilimonas sp.]|nr:CAP domain-containing protein [Parafilimonas sp.]